MASLGISEFTFGYAFLHEQTTRNWGGLRVAPVLPSLQKEYEEGWDAHLPLFGADYYYQFKLTDYLHGHMASFRKDGTYGGPYYRISLHKNDFNRQHRRLKLLSEKNKHTYYVAPEVNEIDDFNSAFLNSTLTECSRLIPLTECDAISDQDSEQHFITFEESKIQWNFHSDRKCKVKSYLGKNMSKFYKESESEFRALDKNYANEIFERIQEDSWRVIESEEKKQRIELEKIMPLLDLPNSARTRGRLLWRTSKILSALFGATLLFVSPDIDNHQGLL